MKNTNNTTKRTLDEIIDVNQYIVSKGTRRVYKKKLVLRENGDMRLNSTFVKSTSERHFAVAFKKDFHEAVVVPNCEPQIQFSKNGVAKDIELVKKFGRKNKLFPLVYNLDWDEKKQLWIGKLDQETKE